MTIQEALTELRKVIPANERSIFIEISVRTYDMRPDAPPAVEFSVWDEREHYKGPSLAIAVQKCLLGNAPVEATIAEAETLTTEAAAIAV